MTWEKPKIGWTKLNFDGSSEGKAGKASIGGLFRNHKADLLLGYAEPIGRANSMIAELAALRRGLELVLENGWSNVWLGSEGRCYGGPAFFVKLDNPSGLEILCGGSAFLVKLDGPWLEILFLKNPKIL